jgi:hypothetical protein
VTIFDLLFVAGFFASLVILITAAAYSLRGKNEQAIRIVWTWAICAAAYLTISLLSGFVARQRVIGIGEPWCFDDWCLTAEAVTHSADSYNIALRISSEAKRVSQRAAGAWIYLIDDQGRLFQPDKGSDAVPLDVRLEPGQSVETSRVFHVATDARGLGLITGHGGPYCGPMDFLIIGGSGCLFHKQTMIRIE